MTSTSSAPRTASTSSSYTAPAAGHRPRSFGRQDFRHIAAPPACRPEGALAGRRQRGRRARRGRGTAPLLPLRFATGAKPRPPLTDDRYSEFGRPVARFRTAADAFRRRIRAADLHRRLDEPSAQLRSFLADAEENLLLPSRTQYGTTSRSTPGSTWPPSRRRRMSSSDRSP